LLVTVTITKHGLRLSQHGVVISELRTTPGPTHSVVDVLAALIAVLVPVGRIGVLGFAGGGMMAPLHALGVETAIDSVDLDRVGYNLFRKHCPGWEDRVNWQQEDAVGWLRQQPASFGLLVDDLSVPSEGDVVKPSISWKVLPRLIGQRLRPGGFGVFNLLPRSKGKWKPDLEEIVSIFRTARIIKLDEFENRILVTGDELPSSREMGRRLRITLKALRSRQARRFQVQTILSPQQPGA
jgi:spermidine synthase